MTPPLPPTPPSGDDGSAGPSGQGAPPRGRHRPTTRGSLASRLSGLPRGERRSPRAVAVAVGLHLAVGAVLIQALQLGGGFSSWLRLMDEEAPREERITFVNTDPRPATDVTPQVAERPRASSLPTEQAGLPSLPPGAVPVSPPPASAAPSRADTGSRGGGANGIGALDPDVRGVRPGYTDQRVWRGPGGSGSGGGGVATGDRADKLDSIMAGVLMAARDSLDSLARAQGQYGRAPGDWTTTDKNGNKWGWDQQGIKLGKVTIPNALLGLLPMNAATAAQMSGNPIAMGREARLNAARADIQRMGERGMGEAEFKRVLKEMESRRDTQRRERLRAPSATLAAPVNKASDK
jgi:hypothetical protein